jgi:Global regulator protein family
MRPSSQIIDPRAGLVVAASASCAEPFGADRRSVSCEVRENTVLMRDRVWSYYKSQQGKRQMLVLDRGQGERMRINGCVELIVLGIENDQVKLAIESGRRSSA